MRAPILCAALAMLTACTQGGQAEVSTLVKTLAPTLLKSRAQIEADAALVNAAVVADPEGLRNFPAPILVVKAVDLNLVAVIGPLTTNGDESVWYSADNKSLGFRDGQVVATRGLDGDLQSAAVPDIRRARGEVVRDHYYRAGDETIQRVRYFCEITDKGMADAPVLDRFYRTRLIQESCRGEDESFTNAYWIGDRGEIRLSQQWISPLVGYLEVQKVQE